MNGCAHSGPGKAKWPVIKPSPVACASVGLNPGSIAYRPCKLSYSSPHWAFPFYSNRNYSSDVHLIVLWLGFAERMRGPCLGQDLALRAGVVRVTVFVLGSSASWVSLWLASFWPRCVCLLREVPWRGETKTSSSGRKTEASRNVGRREEPIRLCAREAGAHIRFLPCHISSAPRIVPSTGLVLRANFLHKGMNRFFSELLAAWDVDPGALAEGNWMMNSWAGQ